MSNRFLEIFDKNNKPVFESDTCILDISELVTRPSNAGKWLAEIKNNISNHSDLSFDDLVFELIFENNPNVIVTTALIKIRNDKNKKYLTFEEQNKLVSDEFVDLNSNQIHEDFSCSIKNPLFLRYLLKTCPIELKEIKGHQFDSSEKTKAFHKFDLDDKEIEISIPSKIIFTRNELTDKFFTRCLSPHKDYNDEYKFITFSFEKSPYSFDLCIKMFASDKDGVPNWYYPTEYKPEILPLLKTLKSQQKELKNCNDKKNELLEIESKISEIENDPNSYITEIESHFCDFSTPLQLISLTKKLLKDCDFVIK